jgi:MFS family permease
VSAALAPLRHAPFRLLLGGRVVNGLGNAVAPIALAFAVLDLTGSPRDLGIVVGVRTLFNVLFVLFGGVLADRLPRHLLMVATSVAAGLSQAAVAAAVLTGTATIALLIGLSAVNGVFSALAMPATSALLPQTVPDDERQQANALTRLFFNGTMILGASAGGVLIATVGAAWGIAVDAATFLVAAVLFALVEVPRPAVPAAGSPAGAAGPDAADHHEGHDEDHVLTGRQGGRPSLVADLRTGWSEFVSRTWLWVVVAGFAVVNACYSGGLNVLGPVVADQTIGRPAWGFVLAAQTIGMIGGALIALRLRIRRMLFFGVLAVTAIVLPILALGLRPVVVVLLGAAFVAGVGIELFSVSWETTMQEHVPADKLARVYSYDMLGSFIAMPVGAVIVGPVGQAVGVRATLVGAGLLAGLAVLGMLASRDVRHLRHRLPERAPAVMEELPA